MASADVAARNDNDGTFPGMAHQTEGKIGSDVLPVLSVHDPFLANRTLSRHLFDDARFAKMGMPTWHKDHIRVVGLAQTAYMVTTGARADARLARWQT